MHTDTNGRKDKETIELVGEILKDKYKVHTGMTPNEDYLTDLILYTSAGTKQIEVKSKKYKKAYITTAVTITPEQLGDGNIIYLNKTAFGGQSKWNKIEAGLYDGLAVYDKCHKKIYLFNVNDILKAKKGECKMFQHHTKELSDRRKTWEEKIIIDLNKATKIIDLQTEKGKE